MDGVGKTTVATKLAEKLKFKFVEKPLHYLLELDNREKKENYFRIIKEINSLDHNLRAWFYGLSNLYLYRKFKYENIVTDRHLVSNYSWNSQTSNEAIFNFLIEDLGFPDFSFLLYADNDTRQKRIYKRNCNDPDLETVFSRDEAYNRMKYFLTKHKCFF